MKFGMRKPSLKRSLKARTTGRIKRKMKKALIPGYGKKGMGWLKNPQKALYNKVYNKTSFSVSDLLKFGFKKNVKTKNKIKDNTSKVKEDEIMETPIKVPFYKKKWFIILVSVFIPVAGIVFVVKSKKMNKFFKILLTAVASLWSAVLLVIGFAGGDGEGTMPVETTTQAVIEESTTNDRALYETTTIAETTEKTTTEQTTEELTTSETTVKETTTEKQTTTKKETTTRKPTTTAKPTTTQKITTTKKPTTTRKASTTSRDSGITVYRTETGKKYHYENPCGNGTYYPISLDDAKRMGLDACDKCVNN